MTTSKAVFTLPPKLVRKRQSQGNIERTLSDMSSRSTAGRSCSKGKKRSCSYQTFSAKESPVAACYGDMERYFESDTEKDCSTMIGIYTAWHEHFTQNGRNHNAYTDCDLMQSKIFNIY